MRRAARATPRTSLSGSCGLYLPESMCDGREDLVTDARTVIEHGRERLRRHHVRADLGPADDGRDARLLLEDRHLADDVARAHVGDPPSVDPDAGPAFGDHEALMADLALDGQG